MVVGGGAGSDSNVMQEAGSEEEKWKEEGADGAFGSPGRCIKGAFVAETSWESNQGKRTGVCVCVCFLEGQSGRVASVVTDEPASCEMNIGHSSECSCFSVSLCAREKDGLVLERAVVAGLKLIVMNETSSLGTCAE